MTPHRRIWLSCLVGLLLFQVCFSHIWAQDASRGTTLAGEAARESANEAVDVLSLAIDFGDGFEKRYSQVPWTESMVAWDVMQFAAEHPRPTEFGKRGSAAILFVHTIDGQKNEGAGGRNWIFSVNGEIAEASCGVTVVKPGDAILWKFRTFP